MKTKWDCLFAVFELKEARLTDIAKKVGSSPSPVRQTLVKFLKEKIVIREKGLYKLNKNNKATRSIFNIIDFCRNRGINYNIFLNEEFANAVKIGLGKEEIRLSDFKSLDYKTTNKYL